MAGQLSRRRFLAAAAAGGVAVTLPDGLRQAVRAATDAGPGTAARFHFLRGAEADTCAAICARVVPSTDPVSGGVAPGATEARAVVFIDRLLAAFMLPAAVADHPAVYLRGRVSNRNPYPDPATGRPSGLRPANEFRSRDGQTHYLPLDDLQQLSWRALIEGLDAALAATPRWVSRKWVAQVRSGLLPGPDPAGLQHIYRSGLAAFDAYSRQTFGAPFARAGAAQQDAMLEAAGNVVVSQVPLPSPPAAPADAKTLFPYVVAHTFEGCYGLPEYRGMDSNPLWAEIGWDGDTQPLGNSIYDDNQYGPGEGPNAGFGEPGVFVPRGGYREHRPVSSLAPGTGPTLSEGDVAELVARWRALGVVRPAGGAR